MRDWTGFHLRAVMCPKCGLVLRRNDRGPIDDETAERFLSADCANAHDFD